MVFDLGGRRVLNGRLGNDQAATDSSSGVVGKECDHGRDALAPAASEQHRATSARLAIRALTGSEDETKDVRRLQDGRGMVVTKARPFGYEAVTVTGARVPRASAVSRHRTPRGLGRGRGPRRP